MNGKKKSHPQSGRHKVHLFAPHDYFGMVQEGVRYRCAKHPTNLRSVPGRPGNGT